MGAKDFSVGCKDEEDADRFAVTIQIVERDAFGRRRDFLQPERGRRERLKPRPPIGFECRSARVLARAVASAFKARVLCVKLQKRFEIAAPARVEPVNDKGYLIEIFRQKRHALYLMRSVRCRRTWRWSTMTVVNGH
jgi:hypothetical protein